jgi:hypothetical protein
LWYNYREMGPQISPPAGPGERPPEALPQLSPVGPEIAPQNPYKNNGEFQVNPEIHEQKTGAGAGENQAPQQPLAPVVQPTIHPIQPVQLNAPMVDDNPLVADDVDLIEKEWVQKSKAIQKKFRDDPHQQRNQVSALNADYLNKRFGVQVKLPQE